MLVYTLTPVYHISFITDKPKWDRLTFFLPLSVTALKKLTCKII